MEEDVGSLSGDQGRQTPGKLLQQPRGVHIMTTKQDS